MIHYTLLPEKEMHALRREYRTRVLIMLVFFISFGLILGTVSIIPSYIMIYSQEKNSLDKIRKDKEDNSNTDIVQITKELTSDAGLIKKIRSNQKNIFFSDFIKKTAEHKTKSVILTAFSVSASTNASSTAKVVVQGKALTREALFDLKKVFESDPLVVSVELPISDFTKVKDIDFSMLITFK